MSGENISSVVTIDPPESNIFKKNGSETSVNSIIDYLARLDPILHENLMNSSIESETMDIKQHMVDTYTKSKVDFIVHFGRFLRREHLEWLQHEIDRNNSSEMEAEEMSNQLSILFARCNQISRNRVVRNRRYKALQKLVTEGSYFSDKEMMRRCPLLYRQLVGQYLTENEKASINKTGSNEIKLVDILIDIIDRKEVEERIKLQEAAEESEMRLDGNQIERRQVFKAPTRRQWGEFESDVEAPQSSEDKVQMITAAERAAFREEFVNEMYCSFIEGRDENFDYSTIDDVEDNEDLLLLNRDEEDRYFDSETPEEVSESDICNQDETPCDIDEDPLETYMKHIQKHHTINA